MKRSTQIAALGLLVLLLTAGISLINLQTQVSGVLAVANGGTNNSAAPSSDGQVPIWNAASSKYVPGDPIVSGPDAPGVAPTKNPVQIGIFDGTNVQRALGSSAGRLSIDVNSAPTTAVSQSGTWTVQPGNTANTTPWLTTDSASSATGSAVPAKASYIGGNASGNLTGQVICDKNFIVNAFSTSGSTQEVAASGSTKIYVCGFAVNSAATTAVTFKLVYGTGSNCATSPADLSVAVPLQAVTSNAPVGQNVSPPSNVVWSTTASQALCVNLSAAQAVNAQVWYTQF